MEQETGTKKAENVTDQGEIDLVKQEQERILAAKRYHKDDYKRMREDMKIARQGASDNWINNGNYNVPIINRYIGQSVSSLYAKNPTATGEIRPRLNYELWDGKPETAMAALQSAQAGDQSVIPLLLDIEQGRRQYELDKRIAKTLEIVMMYYANEQKPRLKPLMKRFVRRARTCGVGYLMLGFQRKYAQLSADELVQLADSREKLAEFSRRMSDLQEGEISEANHAEFYTLQTLVEDLEDRSSQILREGPKFMFPRATEIIVDPKCESLMGFVGAGWVAREFHKSRDEVKKIYGVDIGNDFTPYTEDHMNKMNEFNRDTSSSGSGDRKAENGMVCVWEVYNKELQQTYTIADGFNGFLVKPHQPKYYIEGFWPIFALTFNDSETEEELFPLSDVHHLKHVQAEYNRSREYRRLHREANKPKYAALKGRLSANDKTLLESAPPHAVIEFEALNPGENINTIIQRIESVPIDPALYETNSEMEDLLRIVGAQEANLGGASGSTATEASIGEGSRMTSLASNTDDLDEFLSDVFEALGQLCLMELSPDTVREIAGKGAAWPDVDRETVAKQIYLKIRAGSSGRPNKGAELANMERGMPYLIQLPGMNPYPLGERYADLLELDIDNMIVEGMPSIQAINSMLSGQGQTQGAGGPNDPAAQGDQGVHNSQSTAPNEPGPQPAYTQPGDNGGQV